MNKVGDKIFIDRDGKTFEHLVNYLRNNGLVYPKFQSESEEKMFLAELQFWNINSAHLDNLPVGHDMKTQYFQQSDSSMERPDDVRERQEAKSVQPFSHARSPEAKQYAPMTSSPRHALQSSQRLDQLGEVNEAASRTTPPGTVANEINDPAEVAPR